MPLETPSEERVRYREAAKCLPALPKRERHESVIPIGLTPSWEQLLSYTRISEADKNPKVQARKIARQTDTAKSLAAEAGKPIGGEYSDPDSSGFDEDKLPEAFLAMIEALPLWGGLAIYNADRVTRSMRACQLLLDVFRANPHLTFVSDIPGLDLSTREGRHDFEQAVLRAQSESLQLSRREKGLQKQLREAGEPTGKPIFGCDPTDQSKIDPERQALLKTAVDAILKGRKVGEQARRWNVDGILTAQGNYWTTGSLQNLLTNPRLAGWQVVQEKELGPDMKPLRKRPVRKVFVLDGKPVQISHGPIIDPDVWDRLQLELESRRIPKSQATANNRRRGKLSGIPRCGHCDINLAYNKQGKDDSMRCPTCNTTIRAEAIEAKTVAACKQWWSEQPDVTVPDVKPFEGQAELNRLTARRTALLENTSMDLAEQEIAVAAIRTKIQELELARKAWLQGQTQAQQTTPDVLAKFEEAEAAGDVETQRDMIRATVKVVRLYRSKGPSRPGFVDLERIVVVPA